jgi:hypothetical protein
MGKGLSKGLSKGVSSMTKSLGNTVRGITGQLKGALTFGGVLGGGALVKEALEAQSLYRDIAFSLEKIPGNLVTWQDIQKKIDADVDATHQKANMLSEAFHEIFRATGDFKYSSAAISDVGLAATASGEEVSSLATAAQLMSRKFGIGVGDIKEGLVSFLQLTGAGGKSIDELTGRFAVMAGEAAAAGMQGTEGLRQLLGLLINLDSTIGEKADPGLKALFQTMKSGSVQLKRVQDLSKMKFNPDVSGLEKIKQMLTTKKGRAAAEMVFTADARQVFDVLAKPFDDAFKKAQDRGESRAEAIKEGLSAFDKALEKSSTVTWNWSDVQKKASDRMKGDPALKLQDSINKVIQAFSKPKMIKAIDRVADKLPILAEKLAELISWIVDNPWKAVGAGIGLKLSAGFASGFASQIAKSLGGTLKDAIAGAIKGSSGSGSLAGAAGASGGVLGAVSAVAGAGLAGVAAGTVLHETVLNPRAENYAESLRRAQSMTSASVEAKQSSSTVAHKVGLIEDIRKAGSGLTDGKFVNMETGMGTLISMFTGAKSPMEELFQTVTDLSKAHADVTRQLSEQLRQESQKRRAVDDFNSSLKSAGQELRSLVPNGTGTTRGTQHLPMKPGSEPVKG